VGDRDVKRKWDAWGEWVAICRVELHLSGAKSAQKAPAACDPDDRGCGAQAIGPCFGAIYSKTRPISEATKIHPEIDNDKLIRTKSIACKRPISEQPCILKIAHHYFMCRAFPIVL
jgi:hypothetical protein